MSDPVESILDERKFLHDISSPLTTLMLSLESAIELFKEQGVTEENRAFVLVNKSLNKVRDISGMIQSRREIVKKGSGQ